MHETWGISGPAFLVLFPLAAIGLTTLCYLIFRLVTRPAAPRELTLEQIAMFAERTAAVDTALAQLMVDGVITVNERGRYRLETKPLSRPSRLSGAVLTVLLRADPNPLPSREIAQDPEVCAALDALDAELRASGCRYTHRDIRVRRLTLLAPAAAFVLGIVRIVAGVANDHPVGLLVLEMLLLTFAAIPFTLWALEDPPTPRTKKDLDQTKKAHSHLSGDLVGPHKIAAASIPTTEVPLSVALFGTTVLLTSFAAEARAFAIPHVTYYSGAGSTSEGGSAGGSADGGGGGGCGG